jgi:hypothetical protein
VTHNNLGGKGPGTEAPDVIEYSNFMTYNDKSVKVIVEAVGDYLPKNTGNNGMGVGGEFGEININTGTSVKLKFTLKDQETDTEVRVPGLYFSVYDLGNLHFSFLF